ncbi:MAG: cation:proton antiporter subunit C [Spirochaetaceae bacterium]|nr:cation:proton antiporter subunit C [Spirochaetaceae bacterium]
MLEALRSNYIEATALILFGIGLATLLWEKNLIKKIIGFNIMETSIFLFLTAKGYIAGRGAPIITDGITDVEYYINPLPSAIVLTGIVIAVSITAFMLALCLKIYDIYGTLDMDKITVMDMAERSED